MSDKERNIQFKAVFQFSDWPHVESNLNARLTADESRELLILLQKWLAEKFNEMKSDSDPNRDFVFRGK